MSPYSKLVLKLLNFSEVVVSKLLGAIKGERYQKRVQHLRNLLTTQGKAAYDKGRRTTPAFTPAGTFSQRANAKLTTPTGLLGFDFDHLPDLADAKARLREDPYIVYAFTSPSGEGLKVAVGADGIVDDATYKHAWGVVAAYFERTYPDIALSNDKSCKDISRLCFVSWDPDLHVNPDAQLYAVPPYQPPPPPPETPPPAEGDAPDYTTVAAALAAVPDCDDYDTWLQVGMALHSSGQPWARSLWDGWSQQSRKFDPSAQDTKWRSFHREGGRHIGEILTMAHQAGWRRYTSTNGTNPHVHGSITDEPQDNPPDDTTTPLTPAWPTMAPEAYHGLVGEAVEALDPFTEADRVAVLLNFLVGIGNLVGDRLYAMVQHDRHPPRLNVVQVGESSKGRKGTAWSTPREILSRVDQAWAANRIKGGLSSGEGLIFNVRDAVWKREPIKERGRVVDYQEVETDPGESDKRLLIYEPEFASALTVMAREGNILSTTIRQAWDSGNLSPLTRNNPIKATAAHISVIGHITRQELLARLDDTSKANGYANRFMWALVKKSKDLPEAPAPPQEVLDPLIKRLTTVFTFTTSHTGLLVRDDNAKLTWAEVYGPLCAEKPGLLGAIIARGEAQVLRLSVLYALLDQSPMIRVEHLYAALAVWQYCEDSARIIFGKRLGDPTADRILEALRAAGRKGMTDNDLYELFGRNKSANDRAGALTMLVALGLAQSAKEDSGGRPRTVWKATW